MLSAIEVMVSVPDRADWPVVADSQVPGVRLNLVFTAPELPRIRRNLRVMQGFLALFGLREIKLDDPSVEWIPETDEERDALRVFSYKISDGEWPDETIEPIAYDYFARAFIAAEAAAPLEVAMNFFRRGTNDIYAKSYIEAIYDFYFVFETLFGDGKFKTAEIKKRFLAANALQAAVRNFLETDVRLITHKPDVGARIQRDYLRLTPEQVIDKIISLRGFLHHHTRKRTDMWHPERQSPFEADAVVLQSVALKVVSELSAAHIWSDPVVSEYKDVLRGHGIELED